MNDIKDKIILGVVVAVLTTMLIAAIFSHEMERQRNETRKRLDWCINKFTQYSDTRLEARGCVGIVLGNVN